MGHFHRGFLQSEWQLYSCIHLNHSDLISIMNIVQLSSVESLCFYLNLDSCGVSLTVSCAVPSKNIQPSPDAFFVSKSNVNLRQPEIYNSSQEETH